MRPRLARLLALMLLAATPVLADDTAEQLQAVEQQLEAGRGTAEELAAQQQKLAEEVAALNAELIAAAAKAQDLEASLSDVETTLAALDQDVAERKTQLAVRRAEVSATLAALLRLSLQPPEALLTRPGAPVDMARAALLLSQLLPLLEERGAALRADLADLAALQQQILDQNAEALAASQALRAEQARLDDLIAAKRELQQQTDEQRQEAEARVASLEAEAKNLRDLVDQLEAEAKAAAEAEAAAVAEAAAPEVTTPDAAPEVEAPPQTAALPSPTTLRDFPASPGGLTAPARGAMLAGFGDILPETQDKSLGLLVSTRAGAQIIATYDGKVVYAGAFRRYGLILILEHKGKYHSLLAGLGRIDVIVGQFVSAGEPVGLMGSPTGKSPELYIELRKDGEPIDPLPWFATSLAKVEG